MPGFGGGVIEMAEKQYKNYDERFLKEESSGSRPVIEYDTTNSDEVIELDGQNTTIKGKFLDGSYCQNADDLKKIFTSGSLFSFAVPSINDSLTMYSPTAFSMTEDGAQILLAISGSQHVLSVVDAPTFEQLKQPTP